MLKELFDTFEELKKYVFIIDRGNEKPIVIIFKNENFYHLVGLHKINIKRFVPDYIKTKSRLYDFMKKNIKKYDGLITNQIVGKHTLKNRMNTFSNILSILKENKGVSLYNLKKVYDGSLYKGDYGLLKLYEKINCLLGLKINIETDKIIKCVPQSWMASNKSNRLVEFKKPIYMEKITCIPIELYDDKNNSINF